MRTAFSTQAGNILLRTVQILLVGMICSSCTKRILIENSLYGTPHFGVISEAYVKLYAKPSNNAPLLALLRAGDIVTIDFITERFDTQFGLHAPWYRVQHQDINGWVFGVFIRPSRVMHEAKQYSKHIQKKIFPRSIHREK